MSRVVLGSRDMASRQSTMCLSQSHVSAVLEMMAAPECFMVLLYECWLGTAWLGLIDIG